MKPHISWSQIEMWSDCKERHRRAYIEKDKIPPAIALIGGGSIHRGIEHNMVHYIENGEWAHLDEVQTVTRDDVVERWEQGVRLTEDEAKLGERVCRDKTVDSAVTLATLHWKSVAPKIIPVRSEREFVLGLKNFPFDIKGVIDIQADAEPGEPTVLDIKTKLGTKGPMKGTADKSGQLTLYTLAVSILDKVPLEGMVLGLDFLINPQKAHHERQTTSRTRSHVTALMHRIECMAEHLEKEIYSPAPFGSFLCQPLYCGYYATCKYVPRERRPVT